MSLTARFLACGLFTLLAGCGASATTPAPSRATADRPATILLSVTHDAQQEPQSVDMALKLAGFSLDEGRRVIIFFNVKGVTVPSSGLPADFAFQKNSPLKQQLADLIQGGVDVHVCPICMQALGVKEADLMEGAQVTTRPSLFANIGPDTVVFTY